MTDKKLTYKEIIKALSNMTYGGHYCAKCKYDNGKGNDRCGLKGCKIARYALDFITRQQAENERLRNAYKQCAFERDAYIEIENTAIVEAKAEAYKEFVERLKEHAYLDSGITGFQEMVVDLSDIENIAYELVGEDNASKN